MNRALITYLVEINRRPEDVFAYLADLERYPEWQEGLLSTRVDTDGPTRVGSRGVDRRPTPMGVREFPFVVAEYDPPRRIAFRVTGGPVRSVATLTLEPTDDKSRSRLS